MILGPAHLAAGYSAAGAKLAETFIINEESIYNGQCVYCINTGIQMQNNASLKENTRRGNIEIQIKFSDKTKENYHCTILSSYTGDLLRYVLVNFICYFFLFLTLFFPLSFSYLLSKILWKERKKGIGWEEGGGEWKGEEGLHTKSFK